MKNASVSLWLLIAVVLVLGLDVPLAHAGGCTPCTTSMECVTALGAPAFCIEWTDGTAACPGMPSPQRGCCPGQGCSALSGRPSCEGEGRCVVVENIDAAVSPDAGSSGSDAGASDSGPRMDSGAGGGDSGSAGTDSGRGGTDAGVARATSGGCGCRASGARQSASALALGIFGGLLTLRLRRRRAP